MDHLNFKHILVLSVFCFAGLQAFGQAAMPDELTRNTIREQIKYVEEHTLIYENYRAIREDMFQKINLNFMDTLFAEKSRVTALKKLTSDLNHQTDSLNSLLDSTRISLGKITTTKNSIRVLGMEVNKATYNTFMWTVVAVLAFILAMGFLIFKRNLFALLRTGKELQELKDEFAAYRQSSRIARERQEMDHFNELRKLKGI